jgi:hypothetical protein
MASADHHVKSGTYEFVLSAVTDFTVVKQLDHVVRAGTVDGTVTIIKSSGGPFEAGSSGTLSALLYLKKSAAGIDLESPVAITDSSGDTWYAVARRSAGDQAVGGGGAGRQEIAGGTGKYEGITGTCEYIVDYLPDNKLVTRSTCQWQRD